MFRVCGLVSELVTQGQREVSEVQGPAAVEGVGFGDQGASCSEDVIRVQDQDLGASEAVLDGVDNRSTRLHCFPVRLRKLRGLGY